MVGSGVGIRVTGATIGVLALAATPAAASQEGGPSASLVLVIAAVLAGVAVGLIPALLLGALLGVVPRPAWARTGATSTAPKVDRAARAPDVALGLAPDVTADPEVLVRPRAVPPAAPPETATRLPESAEWPPETAERPPEPTAPAPERRERHRELYEAEYAWQEHRLDKLRQSIRRRLENRPDAGGTR